MTAEPDVQSNWESHCARALARFSAVSALVPLLLPAVFLFGMGIQPGDMAHGEAFRELLQAARSPGWYRVLMVLDVAVWLAFSGTLLLLGGLVARHAPVRSAAIKWCAAGTMIGTLTGLLRLAFVGALAGTYAVELASQGEVLRTFLLHRGVLDVPSQAGIIAVSLGYGLAANSLWTLRGFQKWLSAWIAIPAAASLVQIICIFSGHGILLPLVVANNILGYGGASAAMAATLWRGGNFRVRPESS